MPWVMYPQNYLKTDLSAGSYRITLHDSYTPSVAHDTWSDVSATELSTGSGYTANGVAATVTRTVTSANVQVDVADVTFSSFTGTFDTAILWKDENADNAPATTDPLVAYFQVNSGSSVTGTGDTTIGTTDNQGGGAESYFYDVDLPTS